MLTIESFANPFTVAHEEHTYKITPGATVLAEIEHEVLQADAAGRQAKEAFTRNCFDNSSSQAQFFVTTKILRLKTMGACNKKINLIGLQKR